MQHVGVCAEAAHVQGFGLERSTIEASVSGAPFFMLVAWRTSLSNNARHEASFKRDVVEPSLVSATLHGQAIFGCTPWHSPSFKTVGLRLLPSAQMAGLS